jgi:hypothetical protein
MQIWLRSIFDAILGKIPGKTSRPDTATRMAIDADFTDRRHAKPPAPRPWQERDDAHPRQAGWGVGGPLTCLEELMRIINEAQQRDAEDERRLYGPPIPEGLSFQRLRPDRR